MDERIAGGLAALVEASHRFRPQPGKDGVGYYLQYILSFVAGALRNGAHLAKDWNDEALCFTNVAPDDLGIEWLFEMLPGSTDEEPDGTLFVLHTGKVASTLEIVELIAGNEGRRRIAACILDDTVWAEARDAWCTLGWADEVIAAMQGGAAGLDEVEAWALGVTDHLADAADGEAETAARVLAGIAVNSGIKVKTDDGESPRDVRQEQLDWYPA